MIIKSLQYKGSERKRNWGIGLVHNVHVVDPNNGGSHNFLFFYFFWVAGNKFKTQLEPESNHSIMYFLADILLNDPLHNIPLCLRLQCTRTQPFPFPICGLLQICNNGRASFGL